MPKKPTQIAEFQIYDSADNHVEVASYTRDRKIKRKDPKFVTHADTGKSFEYQTSENVLLPMCTSRRIIETQTDPSNEHQAAIDTLKGAMEHMQKEKVTAIMLADQAYVALKRNQDTVTRIAADITALQLTIKMLENG